MHRWIPVAALAALGILAPAASAQTASCPGADTTISAATVASAKTAVLCIVNAERSARGLPTLRADDQLAAAAQAHTDDMVANDYFSHPSLDGTQPWDRILAAGYRYAVMFENIATGQATPRQAVAGWLASTHGHCEATLDPQISDVGIGVAPTAATLPGQIGGTWTEDFGLPLGTPPASTNTAPADGCPYTSFAGLSPARQPDAAPSATGSPAPGGSSGPGGSAPGGSGRPSSASAPSSSTMTTTSAKPAPTAAPQSLDISLRHAGTTLTVSGALRPKFRSGTRVRIAIGSGRHFVRHLGTRLDRNGRFRVRLRALAVAGPFSVRVSVGRLRVTRTVGR